MATPSKRHGPDNTQNDPGVTNDPKSNAGHYDLHILTSLNQIFERLGKIDANVGQLSTDHQDLKKSVEKHDKIIARVGFTIAGAILVIGALWFIYENLLKGHIALK